MTADRTLQRHPPPPPRNRTVLRVRRRGPRVQPPRPAAPAPRIETAVAGLDVDGRSGGQARRPHAGPGMTWRCRRCGRFVVPEAREGDRCTACAIHIRAAGPGCISSRTTTAAPPDPARCPCEFGLRERSVARQAGCTVRSRFMNTPPRRLATRRLATSLGLTAVLTVIGAVITIESRTFPRLTSARIY